VKITESTTENPIGFLVETLSVEYLRYLFINSNSVHVFGRIFSVKAKCYREEVCFCLDFVVLDQFFKAIEQCKRIVLIMENMSNSWKLLALSK
jgi:hypothetical protein